MNKFSRGLALVGDSWRVLKANPKLLALPALSFTALLLVWAAVAMPIVLKPELLNMVPAHTSSVQQEGSPVLFYILLGLFYFAMNFVIIFFNVALISCVIAHLEGRPVSVGDGLKAAASRLPQIIGWAALAATVGVILKAIEERVPAVAKIVITAVGFAWSVVTYFVVPVLALERLGPISAVKRSGEIIKKTWGESAVGALGLGALTFLLMLPGFFIIGFGFWRVVASRPNTDWTPMLLAGLFAVMYFIAVGLVTSALKQIFVASAYVYATRGQVSGGFSPDTLQHAFDSKK